MARRKKDDPKQMHREFARKVFITNLRMSGNVTEACRNAFVARCIAYTWRDELPEFRKAWDEAMDEATDALEREARRRAIEGWEEPVFGEKGEKGRIRRYSDKMLEILLKGHRPERFREHTTVEHEIGPNLAARLEAARKRVK
jgi:hypothetical protein